MRITERAIRPMSPIFFLSKRKRVVKMPIMTYIAKTDYALSKSL